MKSYEARYTKALQTINKNLSGKSCNQALLDSGWNISKYLAVNIGHPSYAEHRPKLARKALTADEIATEVREVRERCEERDLFTAYWKCGCIAEHVREARKQGNTEERSKVIYEILQTETAKECADYEDMYAYHLGTCEDAARRRNCECFARTMADKHTSGWPYSSMSGMYQGVQDAMRDCDSLIQNF